MKTWQAMGLNPFYFMESILIRYEGQVEQLIQESLNPFYFMESILIR